MNKDRWGRKVLQQNTVCLKGIQDGVSTLRVQSELKPLFFIGFSSSQP